MQLLHSVAIMFIERQMGSASAGWLFSASRSGSAPVLLGKMRTSRSVSLATKTAVVMLFRKPLLFFTKDSRKNC